MLACSQGTKCCGRARCLTCSSGRHVHCSRLSACRGLGESCSAGLHKVALVEASDSSAAPQSVACFFSTLEGCDKPLQGTLNHHVEDA